MLAVIAPWLDALFGVNFNRIALLVAGEGILGMLVSVPTLFRFMGAEMVIFSFREFAGYMFQLVPVIVSTAAFVPMFIDAWRLGIVGNPIHDPRWYIWLILGSLGVMRSFRGGLLE
ncbi:MAG: hypothetical protein ACP5QG_04285 [candidate division WOR-3 bacterium]